MKNTVKRKKINYLNTEQMLKIIVIKRDKVGSGLKRIDKWLYYIKIMGDSLLDFLL